MGAELEAGAIVVVWCRGEKHRIQMDGDILRDHDVRAELAGVGLGGAWSPCLGSALRIEWLTEADVDRRCSFVGENWERLWGRFVKEGWDEELGWLWDWAVAERVGWLIAW